MYWLGFLFLAHRKPTTSRYKEINKTGVGKRICQVSWLRNRSVRQTPNVAGSWAKKDKFFYCRAPRAKMAGQWKEPAFPAAGMSRVPLLIQGLLSRGDGALRGSRGHQSALDLRPELPPPPTTQRGRLESKKTKQNRLEVQWMGVRPPGTRILHTRSLYLSVSVKLSVEDGHAGLCALVPAHLVWSSSDSSFVQPSA